MSDSWVSAMAYERFMGRWSALVGQKFLRWLAVPPARRWLDLGCGTGALSRHILAEYQPQAIIAVDSSSDFIGHARRSIASPAVDFKLGQAQSLDVESNSVDAAVSGLVLNFIPEPAMAVAEMLRVTRPGGTVGIFVWDYAAGMQMLRAFWDAAAKLDAAAVALDEGLRFPICQAGQLEACVRATGLRQIEAAAIEIPTVFQNFADYWQPFLGTVGPAPAYAMILDENARRNLESALRAALPVGADGSIALTARAWAVKGVA